jgi:curved DNA-binding protein
VSNKDYYSTLQIPRLATQDEVTAAYRKLAREYHPDVSKHADAEARFKDIGEAYDVLKDPEKRALYDQYGSMWKAVAEGRVDPNQGFGAEGFGSRGGAQDIGDLGSMFEQFFGGGMPRGGAGFWQASTRGSDVESTLRLSVEEAYKGGQRHLEFATAPGAQSGGVKVNIPAGVRHGQRIRLAGQGGPAPQGGQRGDLYLKIELDGHGTFKLEGNDVVAQLWVKPWEAALGAKVAFKTLDSSVRLKVPAGTSGGRRIRLRGKGYPDGAGGRGDLFAEVRISIPTKLSAEQRKLYEELAQLDGADASAANQNAA